MPTAVISARVDTQVRDAAARHIKAAGLTPGEVIRAVWDRIAQTGEMPQPLEDESSAQAASERFRSFMELRAALPARPELASMTDAEMRALVAGRYER